MEVEDVAGAVLRRVFGFESFRGIQREVVEHVIRGGDALVLMPTASGKSVCYQVPALVREGVGVVVSPLLSLMADQVNALRALGVRAAALNSLLSPEETAVVVSQVRRNDLDLLYLSPERVVSDRCLRFLQDVRIALFAIDEAHLVSEWGHSFRPEYLRLAVLAKRFPLVPKIALTATAEALTREEDSQAWIEEASSVRSGIRPAQHPLCHRGKDCSAAAAAFVSADRSCG